MLSAKIGLACSAQGTISAVHSAAGTVDPAQPATQAKPCSTAAWSVARFSRTTRSSVVLSGRRLSQTYDLEAQAGADGVDTPRIGHDA